MTGEGYTALDEELKRLKSQERPAVVAAIAEARAHGDLSENAEYHAAKDRQGFVNARLGQLRKRLAELAMVDFTRIPHGKAGLGSTLVVVDTKTDTEITYHLVTTEE